jgi:serine/threonine protein kinase
VNESPRTPLHREDNLPVDSQRVLSGRYELGGLIGRGGMADVYRGMDTRLGRTVAVKLLRPDMARDPQFQARFKREAQSVAALNHPSIVAIYDTGEHMVHDGSDDNVRVPYIVMEYVEGRTIRDLIRGERGQHQPGHRLLHGRARRAGVQP